MADGAWDERLICYFNGWVAIEPGVLFLVLPEGSCCDMRGAIKVARAVMPGVIAIYVTSGGRPDIAYMKRGRQWEPLYWAVKD